MGLRGYEGLTWDMAWQALAASHAPLWRSRGDALASAGNTVMVRLTLVLSLATLTLTLVTLTLTLGGQLCGVCACGVCGRAMVGLTLVLTLVLTLPPLGYPNP